MSKVPVEIRKLTVADLSAAVPLLLTLNPETSHEIMQVRLEAILRDHPHYRLIGAFSGDELAGVCGAWLATKIWCGLYLEIDNLVVDEKFRSHGIGSLLIQNLETHAKDAGCKILVLDSYTGNHASHRLYHRLGFEIWGFHFVKPLADWKGMP